MGNDIVIIVDVGTLTVHITKYLKNKKWSSYHSVRDILIDQIFREVLQDELGYNIVDINAPVANPDIKKLVKIWKDTIWSKLSAHTLLLDLNSIYYLRTLIVRNKIYLKLEEVL